MSGAGPLWPALLPHDRQGDDALCMARAEGTRVTFTDGTSVLCGTSGLWNANLGYGNTAIADACATALREASYLGVFRYEHELAREAAAALVSIAGLGSAARVIYSTSGGAANDLVMKLCRVFHQLRGDRGRPLIVGLKNSYHGLTYGSFALTGEDLGQRWYAVDGRFVRHVTVNSVAELDAVMRREGNQVAAIVVEPVLGTGTVPMEPDYIRAIGAWRDDLGFVLVADEVATGFGRTGPMLATDTWPIRPDIVVLSKGLTNGTQAAAAVVVSASVAAPFARSGVMLAHAETQAGTAVACAAILATLAEFRRLEALARGQRVATRLEAELDSLVSASATPLSHVGVGLFRTLQVSEPDGSPLPQPLVADLVSAVRARGVVVHPGLNGLQLVPALLYTEPDVTELVTAVADGLELFRGKRMAAA